MRNGQPFQVSVRTTPYTTRERLVADLGLYAQDTWTLKRLTINAGLRWDYLNNKVETQDTPGGTWIGPRHFDALTNVPNFNDLSPRLGFAYDLFGDGKTALKATLSRYVQTSTVGFARLLNPINLSGNSATRALDRQRRRHPAGVGARSAEQHLRTGQRGDALRSGNDSRVRQPPQQLGSLDELSRELMSRVSAEVSYFRRAQGHFTTTDNLDIAPSDFTPYCVTRAARSAAARRRRPAGLRPVRRLGAEVRCRHQQHRHLRRELRQQADRGVRRRRHRRQRAAAQRSLRHRRLRHRQHEVQQLRGVRRQPGDAIRPCRTPRPSRTAITTRAGCRR